MAEPWQDPIEEAIKLLQGNGYAIFRESAGLQVASQSTVSLEIAASDSGDRYMDGIRRNLARDLSMHLYTEGMLKFEAYPGKGEEAPSWMPPFSLIERATHKFYPTQRKEWRR